MKALGATRDISHIRSSRMLDGAHACSAHIALRRADNARNFLPRIIVLFSDRYRRHSTGVLRASWQSSTEQLDALRSSSSDRWQVRYRARPTCRGRHADWYRDLDWYRDSNLSMSDRQRRLRPAHTRRSGPSPTIRWESISGTRDWYLSRIRDTICLG
jgi:hypothetical protein